MLNNKIQLWELSIAGYNCHLENIKGQFNCCADLLSRIPTANHECEENKLSEMNKPVFKDNLFKVKILNLNTFSSKRLAKCQGKQHDEMIKPFIDLPEQVNTKESQQNDRQIKKLKNKLQRNTFFDVLLFKGVLRLHKTSPVCNT